MAPPVVEVPFVDVAFLVKQANRGMGGIYHVHDVCGGVRLEVVFELERRIAFVHQSEVRHIRTFLSDECIRNQNTILCMS